MQAISDACASYLSDSENASLRNGMKMLHLSRRIYEAEIVALQTEKLSFSIFSSYGA